MYSTAYLLWFFVLYRCILTSNAWAGSLCVVGGTSTNLLLVAPENAQNAALPLQNSMERTEWVRFN